MTYSIGCFNW